MTKAQDLIAEAFEIPVSEVPENAAIGRFEAWTAPRHARLFEMVERTLGRGMTGAEASAIHSIKTLQVVLDDAEGTET